MLTLRKKRSLDADMTTGSTFRHLIVFALPLLLGNLFQMLYNMVDTLVVGWWVSDAAFAAVGNLSPVTNLMIGFFTGFASGAGVVISKLFGANNRERVKSAVATALIMTAVFCVVITAVGILMIEPFLIILDMPKNVEAEARTYLTIWISGISGLMIYNIGAGIMRAVGDSKRPFILLVVCALLNTVLDVVFVKSFGMGVEGVAIATVVAQGISALLVVIMLFTSKSAVQIDLKRFNFDRVLFKTIVALGLPAALRLSITSFSNIFVQSYINAFGEAGMGGWTAYNKIDMVVLLPMQSLSLAASTFVGQNIGAKDMKRAEHGANVAFFIALACTVALVVPIVIFPGFFVSIFNSNPEIIEYGSLFLRLLTPFYVIWCVTLIYSGALNGAGNTFVTMVIMLSSFVAFRQVYLFVVSNYISNDPVSITLGYPLGWTIAAIATFIYYKVKGLAPKEKKTSSAMKALLEE